MRLFTSICVLLWTALSLVNARSAAGNRLLVVQEDATEKELYSQLWSDLKGMRCSYRTDVMADTDNSQIVRIDI